MAHTVEDAEFLFSRIQALEGLLSLPGQELTASLLDVVCALLPTRMLKPLPPMLVRILVGDQTADMLAVEFRNRTPFRQTLLRGFATAEGILDRIGRLVFTHFSLTASLARWVGRRVIVSLYMTEQGHQAQLEIPEELKSRWKLDDIDDTVTAAPPSTTT